jgi:hypothetical protein
MLPTALLGHFAKARFLLDQHASTILTGMGVAGTVSTAVLTGRSTFKAAEIIRKKEYSNAIGRVQELSVDEHGLNVEGVLHDEPEKIADLSTMDKLRLIWPLYIPPAITGITTIMAIVSANRIDSKKIAALTVAAGVSDRTLQEYKTKLEEKLTARQYANVKDEIANDRVQATPVSPNGGTVIIGEGKVLCFDNVTGRYFYSTAEEIRKAENKTQSLRS